MWFFVVFPGQVVFNFTEVVFVGFFFSGTQGFFFSFLCFGVGSFSLLVACFLSLGFY